MSPMQQMFLGGGKATDPVYIDDVFKTYLWRGNNGENRTITNGIDMSSDGGGMTWIKGRTDTWDNVIFDTVRGASQRLIVNDNSGAQSNQTQELNSFLSTGFKVGNGGNVNAAGQEYVSHTWKEQKGFFDIVTYSGNSSTQVINHNLGAMPGFIAVRDYSHGDYWTNVHCYDYSKHLHWGLTNSEGSGNNYFNGVTSTTFTLTSDGITNQTGRTYVAYIFAGGHSEASEAKSLYWADDADKLKCGDSSNTTADFNFGTGDLTIECWIKCNSTQDGYPRVVAIGPQWAAGQAAIHWDHTDTANTVTFYCYNYSSSGPLLQSAVKKFNGDGQWHHVAVSRNGNTWRLFVDGILENTATWSGSLNSANSYVNIGNHTAATAHFSGRISNVRIIKGTAAYTSSFRVPNKPLTNVTNTVLLCCNSSSKTGATVTPITLTEASLADPTSDSPFIDPATLKFGETKDQGLIKCGVFKGNGSGGTNGPKIHLGWEPSYVMWKNADSYTDWEWQDNMRRTSSNDVDSFKLEPNTNHMEEAARRIEFTATGFDVINASSNVNEDNKDIVYIAIRREDGYVMKAPSAANKVFTITGSNSNTVGPIKESGFPVDFAMLRQPQTTQSWFTSVRLKDGEYFVMDTESEAQTYGNFPFDYQNGWVSHNSYASNYHSWMWRRWKGMEVTCFWGNGQAHHEIAHGMNAVPEMMWLKDLDSNSNKWNVYHKGAGGGTNPEDWYILMTNGSSGEYTQIWDDTAPTATHFTVGSYTETNNTNHRFVMMLFASGNDVNGNLISKCGYYAGNDSTNRTITVGFQPRYLLVKCLEGSHWQCLDTTRGWGSTDEIIELSSSAAQTSANYGGNVGNPVSNGFTILTADTAWNESGKNYIYYAHK